MPNAISGAVLNPLTPMTNVYLLFFSMLISHKTKQWLQRLAYWWRWGHGFSLSSTVCHCWRSQMSTCGPPRLHDFTIRSCHNWAAIRLPLEVERSQYVTCLHSPELKCTLHGTSWLSNIVSMDSSTLWNGGHDTALERPGWVHVIAPLRKLGITNGEFHHTWTSEIG